MGSRHRPGTALGPANDPPSTLRAPAGDPTPITQVKVRTRAKSITGFSLSKPVPGFKTGYRFSGSRLTSLGRTNLDFTEARDSGWQWHQLGHMQVCTSLQTDSNASTPPLSFYRPDALPATQPTASKH